jgi:ubiquinone/menaquinone biosynthesis C-methylase UbiE
MAAREARLSNVLLTRAAAESLPLSNASVDIAMVNGLFNLNPPRTHIFRELSRVIRSGGAVYAAELILEAPLPSDTQQSEDDWFA